jgi:hypothetical protein
MLPGLIEIESLQKHHYDGKKSGPEARLSEASRPQVGGVSGPAKLAPEPMPMRVPEGDEFEIEENTYRGARPNGQYVLTMSGEVK